VIELKFGLDFEQYNNCLRKMSRLSASANELVSGSAARLRSHPPSVIYFGNNLHPSKQIAAFDLDGTLVRWKPGMKFSLSPDSWLWWNQRVPEKLRVRRSLWLTYTAHFATLEFLKILRLSRTTL
jgi:hypothetical protein